VDVGLVHDSTAVVVAWPNPASGRVVLEARVFASDPRAVAHERVDRARMLSRVEEWTQGLAGRLDVVEVVYDPRFFERSAEILSDAGLTLVEVPQGGSAMADAYQAFYAAAVEGRVAHDGDPVLADHVTSTAAEKTERGWRVRKVRHSKRIDACVAAVMAHYRAARFREFQFISEVWD
jgi:phage terminase large subunit-like protein